MAKTGKPQKRRAAQAFVDHLNSVLNGTVSDSRLSLISLPFDEAAFDVARLVESVPVPLDVFGGPLRLFVRQMITVVGDHCQTEAYSYRLQTEETPGSWLIRWEYNRDPPRRDYPYPPAHLHVNGEFEDLGSMARLHLPTRRVPLELVIWHLIAEWGLTAKTNDWQAILRESIKGFDQRRTD